ncbi:unnamed protein product [Urochloa decumbens]|uniref:Uncharacterized protein n=1 Tax=Urochloa decumbens TaxID=240449 RepID=A0ABC9ECG8_9POAL
MQALPPAKDEAAVAEASVTAPIPPPRPGTKAGKPTTLLDVQEVGWITRELERLLAREQKSGDGAGADWRRHRRTERAKLSPAPRKGGFLAELLGRHAVSICGGSETLGSSAAAAGVDRRGSRRGGWGSCREVEMA